MNAHPCLRAFLAGVFVPTLVLPLILCGFIVLRIVLLLPVPIERALVFPMALAPVLWGLWNMLWIATRARTRLPIWLHGMLLPFLLLPAGTIAATTLGILTLEPHGAVWFHTSQVSYGFAAVSFLLVLVFYFFVWKYVVGWMNRVLRIS